MDYKAYELMHSKKEGEITNENTNRARYSPLNRKRRMDDKRITISKITRAT